MHIDRSSAILLNYRSKSGSPPRRAGTTLRRCRRPDPLAAALRATHHRPGLLRHELMPTLAALPHHLARQLPALRTPHRKRLIIRHPDRRRVAARNAAHAHWITLVQISLPRRLEKLIERKCTDDQRRPEHPQQDSSPDLSPRVRPDRHFLRRRVPHPAHVEAQRSVRSRHRARHYTPIAPRRLPPSRPGPVTRRGRPSKSRRPIALL
jgi:hypothetical protein